MKSVIQITGMSCGKCAGRVETALRWVAGVSEVSVDLAAKTAQVRFDGQQASAGQLTQAVAEAGYGVAGVRNQPE